MGLTKSGEIQYRSQCSQCQKCSYYIKDYNCWFNDYIHYQTWESGIGYECKYFNSILKDQNNSHYVHQDYEDKDRFPEKKFDGKYRFDKAGNRI